jgi:chromate reductase
MKILGISGSLRQGSLNTLLLQEAGRSLPDSARFSIASIADLPLYNEDLDGESQPSSVVALRQVVAEADALIIASPEYNYSIPGGLKNALDWLSRPAYKSPLAHKPVALVSASKSPVGGARVQGHLKQVLLAVLSEVYPAPEFLLASAHEAFDDKGYLKEQRHRDSLARLTTEFYAWSKRVKEC